MKIQNNDEKNEDHYDDDNDSVNENNEIKALNSKHIHR